MAKGKMLLGLLAGAAAGAVVGVLMAPGKGSETRKNLSKRGRDTVDSLKDKVSGMVDTVSDKFLSVNENQGSSRGDSGLERTRSTASPISTGAPSTNSFT